MKKSKNAIMLFAIGMICMLLLCACGIRNSDSGAGKTDSKTDSKTENSEKKLSDIIIHDFYPAID